MTLASKHVHKFKRDSYSTGKKFYYCINGNCTFKIDVRHSLGKFNLCHSCGNPFQMNEYSIRAANPKCMDCIKRRTVKPSIKETDDVNIAASVERQLKQVDSVLSLQEKLNSVTNKTLQVIEYNPDDEKDTL